MWRERRREGEEGGSFISFRLDNCIFYHIRLFILSWQFIVEKHKRLIVKSISLKHSFLFTMRLFSCERKKREKRRGEFFQIGNQLWAGRSPATVEFEYERKMMNRSTALLIGPIFTVEHSRNVKHSLSSAPALSTSSELSSELFSLTDWLTDGRARFV